MFGYLMESVTLYSADITFGVVCDTEYIMQRIISGKCAIYCIEKLLLKYYSLFD